MKKIKRDNVVKKINFIRSKIEKKNCLVDVLRLFIIYRLLRLFYLLFETYLTNYYRKPVS